MAQADDRTFDEEAPSAQGELTRGTILDERFRVEGLLGMGGMGAVYEVTHTITKHRRALKLLHPQYARQRTVVERFFREASAAGHIGNAHIIETFDAGWLPSGEPYLAMELLDGLPLADRIEMLPDGMDLDEATEIFEQLCDGVQAAHDAGIVHRDLKPDNVFLARGGGRWQVKVLDFGVSKFDERLATKLTSGGSLVGTPAYMSPEQLERGADVEPPSDVYALGVILYEMLAGTHPYPAETLAQLMKMILTSQPAPIAERRPGLPPALQVLLDDMLELDAEIRIASPREAAARLAAIPMPRSDEEVALHSTAMSDPPAVPVPSTRPVFVETQVMEVEEDPAARDNVLVERQQAPPRHKRKITLSRAVALGGLVLAVSAIVLGRPGPTPKPMAPVASVSAVHVSTTPAALPPEPSVTPTTLGSVMATSTAPPATAPRPLRRRPPAPPKATPSQPAPAPTADRAGLDELPM